MPHHHIQLGYHVRYPSATWTALGSRYAPCPTIFARMKDCIDTICVRYNPRYAKA